MSWRISGSYFESCNCDPICPCRRIDGVAGRPLDARRLHGRPLLDDRGGRRGRRRPGGHAGRDGDPLQRRRGGLAVDLDPLPRRAVRPTSSARRSRRSSPAASAATRRHTSPGRGRRASCVAVRPVEIDVDHTRRRQLLRIRDHVSVRIRDRYHGAGDGHLRDPGPRSRAARSWSLTSWSSRTARSPSATAASVGTARPSTTAASHRRGGARAGPLEGAGGLHRAVRTPSPARRSSSPLRSHTGRRRG